MTQRNIGENGNLMETMGRYGWIIIWLWAFGLLSKTEAWRGSGLSRILSPLNLAFVCSLLETSGGGKKSSQSDDTTQTRCRWQSGNMTNDWDLPKRKTHFASRWPVTKTLINISSSAILISINNSPKTKASSPRRFFSPLLCAPIQIQPWMISKLPKNKKLFVGRFLCNHYHNFPFLPSRASFNVER